jgi:hypothetical protein
MKSRKGPSLKRLIINAVPAGSIGVKPGWNGFSRSQWSV